MEMRKDDRAGGMVNMTELADLLDMSLPTLRALIRDNPDFPVAKRGDKGDPYEFDAAAVAGWFEAHRAQAEAAKEARRAELAQMRLNLFPGLDDDDGTSGLSPAERKAELEAQVKADQLARLRGELLPAAEVDRVLSLALAELAKDLRALPRAVARKHDLDRAVRLSIEAGIREHFNAAIDRVRGLLDGDDAAAA